MIDSAKLHVAILSTVMFLGNDTSKCGDTCWTMAETVGRKPAPLVRRLYTELPAHLRNPKCISGENKENSYEHRRASDHLRRDYHFCRSYPLELGRCSYFEHHPDYRVKHDQSAGGHYYPDDVGMSMCNDPGVRLNAYAQDQPYGRCPEEADQLPGNGETPYQMPGGAETSRHETTSCHCQAPGGAEASHLETAPCQTPGGAETSQQMPRNPGNKTHRELMRIQRPDPSVKPDTGYRSRWGFHQP